jgi:hypothetical protein
VDEPQREVLHMATTFKIHRACIDPPGKDNRNDYNTEWVEIKTDGPADLSGFTLDHFINPQSLKREWSHYYVFGSGENFAGITVIRVHSGHGQSHITREADGSQIHHRYVADGEEKGQWRLNDTGDSVRLVSTAGTVVAERTFTAGHCDGNNSGKPQEKPQTQYA